MVQFFVNATAFFYHMQCVVWMSIILFTWCDCDGFLHVTSHMNGLHTSSVQL